MNRVLVSVIAVIFIATLVSYGVVRYSAKGTQHSVSSPTVSTSTN
ncbi:MAG: hypothetical protein AAB927_02550 [Patescibacteria group bacterium]